MLKTVKETSITVRGLEQNSTHSYIVQPISYIEVADNVSSENSVKATCGAPVNHGTESCMELLHINELSCWLYTPENIVGNMPLIVYLHGINGKGDDPGQLLVSDEFTQWLADGTFGKVPAYVLLPQLPSGKKDWLTIKEDVVSVIREVVANCPINSSNVSLTGFSMGGTGVWGIAASYPELFRCIAPCSGGIRISKTTLHALGNMKIWTFVGTEDTVVKPWLTIDFMKRLTRSNPQAAITQLDGASHTDIPSLVYLNGEIDLIHWLIGK